MIFDEIIIDKNLLDQLNTLCTEYRMHLLDNFEKKLKEKDHFAYNYYFNINVLENKLEIANEIIEDLLTGVPALKEDGELNHLLEKYLVVTDIHLGLSRDKNTVDHKYQELIAKLEQHKTLLLKDWDKTDIDFLKEASKLLGLKNFMQIWYSFNLDWVNALYRRTGLACLYQWMRPFNPYRSIFAPVYKDEEPMGQEKQELTFSKHF